MCIIYKFNNNINCYHTESIQSYNILFKNSSFINKMQFLSSLYFYNLNECIIAILRSITYFIAFVRKQYKSIRISSE